MMFYAIILGSLDESQLKISLQDLLNADTHGECLDFNFYGAKIKYVLPPKIS